ncbi:hypothetical protein [Pseudooceanicola sp. HF7]|uniref:hypothetical protein n=1 Tax=Pseudooceanicola sp. HF7 TaxID=2721560 RepID=UPI00142FB4C3|nr:hypothetical protein [Pseudooceanicola sp. HF7]NIZ10554.1 hypothetical protein [Pseudooceanicola sp. HF7]
MPNIAPILLFLSLALSGPVLGLLSLPPAQSGLVLVLSPPWVDRGAQIDRAGGHGVGPLQTPLATLVQAEASDFGDRLRAAGPFMVVDGTAIAQFCGVDG